MRILRLLYNSRLCSFFNKKATKKPLLIVLLSVLIIGICWFIFLKINIRPQAASWYNDAWMYRKVITVTNSSTDESGVYILLTGIDSSDANRFQNDCGDIRFVDSTGQLMKYYIDSGCGTGNTNFEVYFPTLYSGDQYIYMYYGNSVVANGFESGGYATEATVYSVSTSASEEKTFSPVVYWKLDEGANNTCSGGSNDACDAMPRRFDLAMTDAPTWQNSSQCISSSCLLFDGSNDYLSGSDQKYVNLEASSGFTINGFFKRNGIGRDENIISKRTTLSGIGSTATNTITTSTDMGAGGSESDWRHHMFYDQVNDRWHALYIDSGSDIHTQSTAANSGTTWTDGVDIDTATWDYDDFSCVLDSDNSSYSYLHCVYSTDANQFLYYTRCQLTGSAPYITCNAPSTLWDAGTQGSTPSASDDVQTPAITIDSNRCLLVVAAYQDASEVAADQHEIWMWKEAAPCGDGTWSDAASYPKEDFISSTGYNSDPGVGIESFGDLDAQIYYTDVDSASAVKLLTTFFNGSTDSITMPEVTLNNDVEYLSNGSSYFSVISGTSNVTFATDDISSDLYAHIISSKDGSAVNKVDTLLNIPSTFSGGTPQLATAVVDTRSPGSNDIWVFGADATDYTDIYYNVSTDGGVTWGTPTLLVNSLDTSETKFYSAAFNPETCDIMLKWQGNSASPFNINTKIINTGSCVPAGFSVKMTSAGKVSFNVADVNYGTDTVTSTLSYADNVWHQFSAVKNGTSGIYLYIDGKLVSSDESLSASGSLVNAGNTFIGIAPDGVNEAYGGSLDEIKVYNNARTSSQVKLDYTNMHTESGATARLGANSTAEPLNSNLSAYWKMNESAANTCTGGSNDACDSAGNNNDMAWDGSAPAIAAGKFGNGLDFETSNSQYMSQSDTNSLSITSDFTLSSWIKLESLTNAGIIAKDTGGSNRSFYLSFQSNKIRFLVSQDGTNVIYRDGATTLSVGTWYHVVGIYNSTTRSLDIYLNGSLDNGTLTGVVPGSIYDGNSIITIGYGANNGYFDGIIDEARIYSRALSSIEVTNLYNWAPVPVGHWKLDENTGSTIYDSTGVGVTGTLMSSPKWSTGKFGSGLTFDGTSYAQIADNSQFDFGSGNFTVEAWVQTKTTSTQSILMKRDDGSECTYCGWFLRVTNTGVLQGLVREQGGAAQALLSSTAIINDGRWHHVVLLKDASNSHKLYVDGVLSGTDTTTVGSIDNNYPINVGWCWETGELVGSVDDVRMYNYARTQSQIIEDMNASHPVGGSPVGSQVGYWKFDEGYGTTQYNSGNGGTALNASGVGTSAPTWSNDGKFGKALNFDGTNDYVSVPDAASISFTGPFTVSGWVNRDTVNSADAMLGKYVSASSRRSYELGMNTTYPIFIVSSNGTTSSSVTGTTAITAGTWFYLAGVYDGTYIKIYVNGKLENQAAYSSGIYDSTDPLRIGDGDAGFWYFDGKIDEVKLYGSALTAEQIKVDYTQGKSLVLGSMSTDSGGTTGTNTASRVYCVPGDTSTCSAPVEELLFDENTGTTANDRSGNSNTGTLTNGPVWQTGAQGSSVSFDGTNDYVSIPGSSTINFADTNFTWSVWFKTNNTEATYKNIASSYNANNEFIQIRMTPTHTVYWEARDSNASTTTITSSQTVNDGKWHHAVGIRDTTNNVFSFYLDGALVGSTSDTRTGDFTAANNSNMHYIGTSRNTISTFVYYFPGQVDNFRIYNYARTPAQVAWEYNKGAPAVWYKLDECQGTTAYNYVRSPSGNAAGNNGTISIGSSGSNTSAGTCNGSAGEAWKDGQTGKINGSIEFDGSDDYMTSDYDIDTAQGTYSIAGWFNSSTAADSYIVSTYAVAVGYSESLQITAGGYASACTKNTGNTQFCATSTTVVTDGNWHNVVGVTDWTNATIKVYVDGKLEASQALTGTMRSDSTTTYFGRRADSGTNYYTGEIDDMRIYNYPLNAVQVKSIMNNGAVSYR